MNVILIWDDGVLLRPRGKLILEYFQNHGLVWKRVYSAAVNTNGSLCIICLKCGEQHSNLWKLHLCHSIAANGLCLCLCVRLCEVV